MKAKKYGGKAFDKNAWRKELEQCKDDFTFVSLCKKMHMEHGKAGVVMIEEDNRWMSDPQYKKKWGKVANLLCYAVSMDFNREKMLWNKSKDRKWFKYATRWQCGDWSIIWLPDGDGYDVYHRGDDQWAAKGIATLKEAKAFAKTQQEKGERQ